LEDKKLGSRSEAWVRRSKAILRGLETVVERLEASAWKFESVLRRLELALED
jgi:hypothetical protein